MSLSDNTINEVRDIQIDTIISQYVDLKTKGKDLLGCCPFHDERTPSFTVNPTKNSYKCFGCGKSGDGIQFVMEKESLPFIEAVEFIARDKNIKIERTNEKVDPVKVEHDRQLISINKMAADKFRESMTPEAKQYLINRDITKEDVASWQLGYAPKGFTMQQLANKMEMLPQFQELGLVNMGGYDTFQERIIFPILNQRHEVIGFGGRLLTGEKVAKYINSAESALYSKSATLYGFNLAQDHIRKMGYAILVEGNVDVITFHRVGYNNTVATCGTALTEKHCSLLKKCCKTVVICRDGDGAGTKAADRDIDLLTEHGIEAKIFHLPEGMDPDDYGRRLEREQIIIEYCQKLISTI